MSPNTRLLDLTVEEFHKVLADGLASAAKSVPVDSDELPLGAAAKLVKRRYSTVLAAAQAGEIEATRNGKAWSVAVASLRRWAKR